MKNNIFNTLSKRIFWIGFAIAFSSCGIALGQSTYLTFGNERMDRGKLVYLPDPKTIIIAGETEDASTGIKLVFLTSLTIDGKVNWYKTYGGDISYAINDWSITADGGFLLSAEQYYHGDRETLYLMKLDKLGNIQWTKLFDEGGNEVEGLSVAPTKDGGFIFTGLIKVATMAADIFYPIKQEQECLYILKTDSKGNKLWSKKFNYESEAGAKGTKVLETADGYLLGGAIGDTTERKADMLLLKINTKGDFMWAKRFGSGKNDFLQSMVLAGNDIYVVGATNSFGDGQQGCLALLSDKGEMKWFKTYEGGGNSMLSSIGKLNENSLLLVGSKQASENDMLKPLILIVGKNGELINSEIFGQKKMEEIHSFMISNTKLYMTGFSFNSAIPKSTQASFLSYDINNQTKKCFFEPVKIIVPNRSPLIVVKDLNKQMLTDVAPAEGANKAPVLNTVVKNQAMVTELFCK